MLIARITTRRKQSQTGYISEYSRVLINPDKRELDRKFWNKYKEHKKLCTLNQTDMLNKDNFSEATLIVTTI